jgi:hypothetical protein
LARFLRYLWFSLFIDTETHSDYLGALIVTKTIDFLNPILFAICTSTFSKLCVTYTVTCRRVLSSAPLYPISTRPDVALGKKTYKLNLKNWNYKYNNYNTNLPGRSFGTCLRKRLLPRISMRVNIWSFGCVVRRV